MEAFFVELSVMYLLRNNERMVELMGFATQPRYSLLTVFYPNGSLDGFLYGEMSIIVSSKRLIVTFAKQIAEAVQFLHSNGFAHSDLKPHNIFIDNCTAQETRLNGGIQYKCRIGDFGLVQVLDDRHGLVHAFDFSCMRGLTIAYAAPEAIRRYRKTLIVKTQDKSNHFLGCDIYALGIILMELSVNDLAGKMW